MSQTWKLESSSRELIKSFTKQIISHDRYTNMKQKEDFQLPIRFSQLFNEEFFNFAFQTEVASLTTRKFKTDTRASFPLSFVNPSKQGSYFPSIPKSYIKKNGISSNCFVRSYPKTSSFTSWIHRSLQALNFRKVNIPFSHWWRYILYGQPKLEVCQMMTDRQVLKWLKLHKSYRRHS